jgi:hypothetical protein
VSLFARPKDGEDSDLSQYEVPRNLPKDRFVKAGKKIDSATRTQILRSTYGEDGKGVLQFENVEQLEPLLFELWDQQWPRLRRNFAFRTRYRVAEESDQFDLQIVERLYRNQQEPRAAALKPTPWLCELAADLAAPQESFRNFLRRFGAESAKGKEDLPPLVGIYLQIQEDADLRVLSRAVCASFSGSSSMAELKISLFGREDQVALVAADEVARLSGVLAAKPSKALDLDALEFKQRLRELWKRSRPEAVSLVCQLAEFEPSNRPALRLLLASAAKNVHSGDIGVLAEADIDLALALVEQRPELLCSAAIWRGDEQLVNGLIEITQGLDSKTRLEIATALLKANVSALNEVLGQQPDQWWSLLNWAGDAVNIGRSLPRTAAILEQALTAVGPASVGSAPKDLSPAALLLLAVVARPSLGLWRQIDSEQWSEASSQLLAVKDLKLRGRALVVLLAAAILAKDPQTRTKLWQAGFKPLHVMLGKKDVSEADLEILAELLPTKSSNDMQERLRSGLVKEMKKDRWSANEVKKAFHAVPAHSDEMAKALQTKKKSRKKWLREVYEFITG